MQKTPSSVYKVRFNDCDPFGHLNNARYLDYFLNAREDHLKDAYSLDLTHYYNQGLSWVVGSHEIQYLKPANYNENIVIQSALLRAADDLLVVEMLMADPDFTHYKAICWTKFIPVSLKTGRKENHPKDFMAFALSIQELIPETSFAQRLKNKVEALKKKN